MYASGIPLGMMVDSKGPKPGVFLGSLALGTGYFGLHRGESYTPRSSVAVAVVLITSQHTAWELERRLCHSSASLRPSQVWVVRLRS